ncbi:MAG: hypothetical protein KAQ62_05780, partial [Cyclobacteriaceae bacterium]|nr:hypothetical protein [Cyclobacteriaceae bacterium]
MIPIHFEKNKTLFNDRLSTGIEISSDIDNKILKALIDDDEISTLKLPVVLGKGKVLAAGNEKKFEFKGDASVSIDGSASGMLRVGIFKTASELIENLKKIDGIEVDLIDPEEDEVIVLFSMGYSVNANASGKWLFTGGSLEAGIGVSKAQRIAVLKKVKRSDNVRTSIKKTLGAFKLPKLIQSSDDLEENTWIIVQSNGSLEGSFGAQVGYDFNWIYETNTPGLSGSVGLQAKLGAQLG